MTRRRLGFRPGLSIPLADGQSWTVPDPSEVAGSGPPYDALIAAVVASDCRAELLRAELALGIYLLTINYDLPPAMLGNLLDFRQGDAALDRLQTELHGVALAHVRAHRPTSGDSVAPTSEPIPRISRGFGFLRRVRASMSA